jgi:nucleoside-diphosphate-sugar epimerase
LIYRALGAAGGDLVVWGDGRQGRAFLHLRDVASGVLKALAYEGEHRTFMLGPDRCTTIGELAALIAAHPRVNVRAIVYDTSMPTGDIGRHADSSLARQELGWRISVPLETGLRELVDDIHGDMTRAPR